MEDDVNFLSKLKVILPIFCCEYFEMKLLLFEDDTPFACFYELWYLDSCAVDDLEIVWETFVGRRSRRILYIW